MTTNINTNDKVQQAKELKNVVGFGVEPWENPDFPPEDQIYVQQIHDFKADQDFVVPFIIDVDIVRMIKFSALKSRGINTLVLEAWKRYQTRRTTKNPDYNAGIQIMYPLQIFESVLDFFRRQSGQNYVFLKHELGARLASFLIEYKIIQNKQKLWKSSTFDHQILYDPSSFKFEKILAKGGFGFVFSASYRGSLVAVKVPLLKSSEDNTQEFEKNEKAFEQEARALLECMSPQVVLYNAFIQDIPYTKFTDLLQQHIFEATQTCIPGLKKLIEGKAAADRISIPLELFNPINQLTKVARVVRSEFFKNSENIEGSTVERLEKAILGLQDPKAEFNLHHLQESMKGFKDAPYRPAIFQEYCDGGDVAKACSPQSFT